MCNSYYNSPNCCCTSPACHNCNGHCVADDCRRFMRSMHHWYPNEKNQNRCACCQQLSCKNNDLLHQLCVVPGVRGETIKQALVGHPVKTSCCDRPIVVPQSIPIPLLKTLDTDFSLESRGVEQTLDEKLEQRLLEKLNGNTGEKPQRQFNDLLKGMKKWYAKDMEQVTRERGMGFYYILDAPRRYKPKSPVRNTLLSVAVTDARNWSLISSFGLMEEEYEDSETTASERMSIVEVDQDQPSDPEEINDEVALEDIRELLKEIENKPSRPILFHSPFNKDLVWTWRNYDPLTDIPSSLVNKSNKTRTSLVSSWTMNVVQNLLAGNPIKDEKIETNEELRNRVNQLAMEIKRRKAANETKTSEKPLHHPHHQHPQHPHHRRMHARP